MASPWSFPWPSFCSLRSSSLPCRLFLNTLGAPSRVRVSAPNQLHPLLGWCLTFAARCLTPRSSRAPTAGHAGPLGGTLYIFANRAKPACRSGQLNSNVRPHTNPRTACRCSGNSVQCTPTSAATALINSKRWAAQARFSHSATGRRMCSRQCSVEGQLLRPRPDGRHEQPKQFRRLLSFCTSQTPRTTHVQ